REGDVRAARLRARPRLRLRHPQRHRARLPPRRGGLPGIMRTAMPKTARRSTDRRRGIQSLEIGLRVLECLEHASDPLTLTQIAQATGMRPSKVHIYLVSLMRA